MTPAQALGIASSFAAGMYGRYAPGALAAGLDRVLARYYERDRLLRGVFGGIDAASVSNVAHTVDRLGAHNTIFAVSQVGCPISASAHLSAHGIKVACVFWRLPSSYLAALDAAGAALVDLCEHDTVTSLCLTLQSHQERGYIPALIFESPMRSRRTYEFLDYRVRCASLLEVYSLRFKKMVLPLTGYLDDEGHLHLDSGPVQQGQHGLTQRLLAWLEGEILKRPDQYLWSPASVIFSDPRAVRNALESLEEILEWRTRHTFA